MDKNETRYYRCSLNRSCTSSELVDSFLEGRVTPEELFQLGEQKFTIAQIVQNDDFIRQALVNDPKFDPAILEKYSKEPLAEVTSFFSKMLSFFTGSGIKRTDESGIAAWQIRCNRLEKELTTAKERLEAEQLHLKRSLKSEQRRSESLQATCKAMVDMMSHQKAIVSRLAKEASDIDSVQGDFHYVLQIGDAVVSTAYDNADTYLKKALASDEEEAEVVDYYPLVDLIGKYHSQREEILRGEWGKLQRMLSQMHRILCWLGDRRERARQLVRQLFNNDWAYVRVEEGIPEARLYAMVRKCEGDLAPRDVLAIFLDRKYRGILISDRAFYMVNEDGWRKFHLADAASLTCKSDHHTAICKIVNKASGDELDLADEVYYSALRVIKALRMLAEELAVFSPENSKLLENIDDASISDIPADLLSSDDDGGDAMFMEKTVAKGECGDYAYKIGCFYESLDKSFHNKDALALQWFTLAAELGNQEAIAACERLKRLSSKKRR